MWIIDDAGWRATAWIYEDAHLRVSELQWDRETMGKWMDYHLPRSRRGRISLILRPPYEARALATLRSVLEAMED